MSGHADEQLVIEIEMAVNCCKPSVGFVFFICKLFRALPRSRLLLFETLEKKLLRLAPAVTLVQRLNKKQPVQCFEVRCGRRRPQDSAYTYTIVYSGLVNGFPGTNQLLRLVLTHFAIESDEPVNEDAAPVAWTAPGCG